ncbi:MAG TPA: NfeD family protein [Anaeromyxobacteraceae bacterium]|nr:NfeD family protein [Anaeromyxobacteraceae bacterium]
MEWWMWVLFGVALLAVELGTPGGLFALFFGAAALAVAALAGAGLGPAWLQWLVFAALGVLLVAFLRRPVAERMRRRGAPVDALVGEAVFPLEDLAPGATGKAELRGVPWTATNASDAPLARGQRCQVARVANIHIFIVPEEGRS